MRIPLATFFISLLSGCSVMKSAKIMKTINHAELANKGFLYDIPFTFKSGVLIVQGIIDGKQEEPLHFIFDTGAYGTVTNTTARAYGLDKVAATTGGDANQVKGEVGIFRISSFQLGALQYSGIGAVGYDHPPLIACLANGGIVGAPLMKGRIWQIDIRKNSMVVTDEISRLQFPEGTKKVPFRTDKFSRPFVDLEINGRKQEFMLDLGATQLLDIPAKVAGMYTGAGSSLLKVVGQGYHGAWGAVQDTITFGLLDQVQLFGDTYRHIPYSYSPKSNQPVIGSELLKYYVLTMDFKAGVLYLTRYADPGTLKITSFGLDLDYKDGQVFVSRIYKDSKAEQAGIALDTRIIAINEKPVTYKSYCEFLEDKLQHFKNDRITLSLVGGKKVSLQKETFLQR